MSSTSVLVVEDELIEAEDIRETLENKGYSVTGVARSGEEALEILCKNHPDLVLMDIHLAGTLDGIDTAERIRTLYAIPVIFLTSYADEVTLGRAKIAEPYGYVLKPFDERELHTAIEMGVYKHRMEEQAKENERTIRVLANAVPDAVMLLDHNRQIIALNNAMARRLGRDPPRSGGDVPVLSGENGISALIRSRLEETLQNGRTLHFEEKTGTDWFEISLNPISGSSPDRPLVLVQYHDISDHKRFEEQLKSEGVMQIEQNMEQFQILNDQIRNPLQAIMGYVSLDCVQYRENIMKQIGTIDNLVARLDRGWVESEKVRKFLLRHYRDKQDGEPGTFSLAGQREESR
jgi:two-component system, response regulator PdtaR